MGWLMYGDPDTVVDIDDRALAHLKVVVTTKLRRNESFLLSWTHPPGAPVGRSSLWLHPSIPLRFTFDAAEPIKLNSEWLAQLAELAALSGNVRLVPEPATGLLTVET